MTRLQTAIAAAEKGDEKQARNVMALTREWFDRFAILWAIIRHAHQTGDEGRATEVLHEATDATKRIRAEVNRADAQIFHATSLAQIGRIDEALAYAREIPDHYAGFHAVQALVSIALALHKMNQSYNEVLEEAGELSKTINEETPATAGESPNWLGQVALRDALFWWKQEGYLNEILPYAKKYLTDAVIMNALIREDKN
ncbi:hypothetical protein KBC55_03335 [Patescibacteria group bacterium]|nr:hypothetical protein [Patescibacteria group bacterium]